MPDRRRGQRPAETGDRAIRKPEPVADGATAVKSALKFALGRAGVVRGVSTRYRFKQFEGVDCPAAQGPTRTSIALRATSATVEKTGDPLLPIASSEIRERRGRR